MTTDQEAEHAAAQVLHLMTQRGKDARNWQRQAEEWEGVAREQRGVIDRLEAERDTAESRRAAAAMDASTSTRLMETAQDQRESAMRQIRDAHGALNTAGVPSEKHTPHEGCSTQLGHRIRAIIAERDQLLLVVGPIAALDLATTWRAEKQHYMERVQALTLALDEQAREIERLTQLAEAYCMGETYWYRQTQRLRAEQDTRARVSSAGAGATSAPLEETQVVSAAWDEERRLQKMAGSR